MKINRAKMDNDLQNSRFIRSMIESSFDPMVTLTPEGKITDINAVAETVTGISRKALIGTDFLNYFTELDKAREGNSQVLTKGYVKDYPLTIRHQKGNFIDVLYNGSVFKDESGNILGIVAVLRDLKKQAEAELNNVRLEFAERIRQDITNQNILKEERNRLFNEEKTARLAAENASNNLSFLAEASTLLASSLDISTTLANVAKIAVPRIADWCAVDILKVDETLQRVAVVHIDPSKVELAYELERRYPTDPEAPNSSINTIRRGEPVAYWEIPEELLIAGAKDEEHLKLIRELGLKSAISVPLVYREKKMGIINLIYAESNRRYVPSDLDMVKDLAVRAAMAMENSNLYSQLDQRAAQLATFNEDLERRVSERTTHLEALNRELEAFSYSVSHDLRAPLRSIDGFSRILLEDYSDKLDDLGKDHLNRVRAATNRMGQLIDDMLKLSHITRTDLFHEEVDISAIAKDIAAELLSSQPERHGQFNIPPGFLVHGDAKLLRIALENLLGNAWKFTGQQPAAQIDLGMKEFKNERAYFVRDNGVGFDMAYANKLFGAFQRLHSMTEFPGTGIGLATVQRVMSRHGGCVWAEAGVNQGATFYFSLPSTHKK